MNVRARSVLAAGLALCLGLLLSGCSRIDRDQAQICVAVATAIAPEGARVSIDSVEPLSGVAHALRVLFTAGDGGPRFFVDCGFSGGPLEAGRTDLAAVRGYDGMMPDRRFFLLKRWFIDEPGAVAAAVRETDWTPPNAAILPLDLPKSVGFALQQLTNTLNIAALYAPLALAYALIYGLIGRINMAFGEIAMIGAFGAIFGIETAIGARLPGLGLALGMALVVALSLAALWGWFVGRAVVLPLAAAPSRPFIVATFGLALALSEGLRLSQGSRDIWLQPILGTPITLAGGPFPVMVTEMRLLIILGAALILPAVLILMKRSAFGRAWRAVADDALMARLSGVDPVAVTGLTFVLASALAGLAGAVLALSYGGMTYTMGLMIGLKALLASLVGGAGSLMGAILGAILIAVLETGWSAYFDASQRDIVVLGVITILFLLRPNGLLGRGRTIEEGRIIRLS
ncbi:branched-chain amino acid ABC transporter permease [Kaistia dalseonensis]|uniref:Branched-chain amino acid transport system permease protein n=1 Tax=Kaistia dalseonensis TaxID=410840 RepID=A0ABU0H238_9HYPH|nr:branched-chain amino acid ABC transporter permease [Kaistia dalseonensis]MCX5493809.1 branched-chain amino acid ABC transporter permease [Kaistia dalseonensis]MDQ0436374.1 branched-chain amino acid transport system permease protein [Kaistia dalseonensis]